MYMYICIICIICMYMYYLCGMSVNTSTESTEIAALITVGHATMYNSSACVQGKEHACAM